MFLLIFVCGQKQQENRYEAQREDIMVEGEITTKFISNSGRMLLFTINRPGEISGGDLRTHQDRKPCFEKQVILWETSSLKNCYCQVFSRKSSVEISTYAGQSYAKSVVWVDEFTKSKTLPANST